MEQARLGSRWNSQCRYTLPSGETIDRQVLHRLRVALSDPRFVLAEKQQEVDDWTLRLERVARRFTQQPRRALANLEKRLANRHPRAVLSRSRSALEPLRHRLRVLVTRRTVAGRARATVLEARLLALSPLAVLGRGYAITLTEDGRVVRRSSETRPGAALRVLLHEGALDVEVTKVVASDQADHQP